MFALVSVTATDTFRGRWRIQTREPLRRAEPAGQRGEEGNRGSQQGIVLWGFVSLQVGFPGNYNPRKQTFVRGRNNRLSGSQKDLQFNVLELFFFRPQTSLLSTSNSTDHPIVFMFKRPVSIFHIKKVQQVFVKTLKSVCRYFIENVRKQSCF